MKRIYDVDFFIKRFESIPEEKWCVADRLNQLGQRCAHGHCYGPRQNPNIYSDGRIERAFGKLAIENSDLTGGRGFAWVNNGSEKRYQQSTPKQRVLACLYDIKAKQQKHSLTQTV